jgi:translation elongation factor EF-G
VARVLSGVSEPNQPEPDPELPIRVIVPEEFAGLSMSELQSRRGSVIGLEVQSSTAFIRGTLPSSEYDAFDTAISVSTQHRGKVEHELDNTD